MEFRYLLAVLGICAIPAQAEIYKAVDADGHVTYSSTPIKGGKKLNLEPLPTMAPSVSGRKSGAPGDFPKVDGETQKSRDNTRYMILQNELNEEERLLEVAKQNLNEASPEVYKGKDGKTYRNVEKYEEKTKPLVEQVELHQKNIEALKTELSKLK